MGKKASGKHYVSKGERKSSITTRTNDPAQKVIDQQNAWAKGQNPWITIPNPNKNETNKRFIRVKANDLYGSPKQRAKQQYVIS